MTEEEAKAVPPEPGRPDLERYTGYLLRRSYVEVVRHTTACMPAGSHVREAVLLAMVQELGPVSGREVAELISLNRTSVVHLVDGVERRGWALRRPHPSDRRSYVLALTEPGRAALGELSESLDRVDQLLTGGLDDPGVRRLRQLLTALLTDDPALRLTSMARRCGYLVVHGHRYLRTRAASAMESLGLHPRDFGALSVLAQDQPCSQNHLAGRLGISPPATLAFVEDLQARGLIARTRSSADRRITELRLTDAGCTGLLRAQTAADRIQASVVELLGAEGDRELRGLLQTLLNQAPEGTRPEHR